MESVIDKYNKRMNEYRVSQQLSFLEDLRKAFLTDGRWCENRKGYGWFCECKDPDPSHGTLDTLFYTIEGYDWRVGNKVRACLNLALSDYQWRQSTYKKKWKQEPCYRYLNVRTFGDSMFWNLYPPEDMLKCFEDAAELIKEFKIPAECRCRYCSRPIALKAFNHRATANAMWLTKRMLSMNSTDMRGFLY